MPLRLLFTVLLLPPPVASRAEDEPLSTVIVTATRTRTAVDSLAAVTVITREEIERAQALSVQDVLRSVPGVQVSASGGLGKATSVFLRGTNEDHVLVLVDGVKVGSATLGTTAFENLPLAEIERIEVVRGPRSSLYGSEAVGGVIQIFTRRGSPGLAPAFAVGGGSFSTAHASASLSAGDARSWFHVSASRLTSEGYNVRDAAPPEPDADGYDNTAFALRAGYRFGRGVQAEAHVLESAGLTEFDGGFVNEADLRQRVLGARLALRPAASWGATLLAGRSIDEQENLFNGEARSRFDSIRDNLSLLNELSLSERYLWTFGLDLQRDRVESTTGFTRDARRNAGAFTQLAVAFAGHDFLVSVRRDDNEQFGGATTGAAAWGWSPAENVSVRAAFGTAFKAPTLNQLYFPGFGNPALEPERSESIEVGVTGDTRWGELSASAYRTIVRDLVTFDPATFFPENVASARLHGLELSWVLALADWRLETGVDVLDAENRSRGADRGKLLPRRARRVLRLQLDRDFGRGRLGARLLAEGRRYDDLANEVPLGGFARLDLLGEYTLGPEWRLQLRVENVLDRGYETAASFNAPGRGVFATLRYARDDRGARATSSDAQRGELP